MLRNKVTTILQSVIIAIFTLLLMGPQDRCQISDELIKQLESLVSAKLGQPSQGQSHVYVTQLEFIDAITKMRMPSEESALIDKAVVTGITRAVQTNPQLKYNDANHTIENTPANVQKLIDIIFDPLLTPEKRMGQIISDIMSPAKVDVIVTGQYVDNQQTLQVRPFTIVKASQKIVSKALDFKKDEYFCPDPVDKNRKALCQNAHESIAQAVKELLESL